MADRPRMLPGRGQSHVPESTASARSPEEQASPATVQPIDVEGTAALADSKLRALAREPNAPGVRLAACWRLMIRHQALPKAAPSEGIRRLTLLNLAVQHDIELLEVLVSFDPSSGVRAQAAMLLWRVALDRDRVVRFLLSRLHDDPSQEVRTQLLTLHPPLPRKHALHVEDGARPVKAVERAPTRPESGPAFSIMAQTRVTRHPFPIWSFSLKNGSRIVQVVNCVVCEVIEHNEYGSAPRTRFLEPLAVWDIELPRKKGHVTHVPDTPLVLPRGEEAEVRVRFHCLRRRACLSPSELAWCVVQLRFVTAEGLTAVSGPMQL